MSAARAPSWINNKQHTTPKLETRIQAREQLDSAADQLVLVRIDWIRLAGKRCWTGLAVESLGVLGADAVGWEGKAEARAERAGWDRRAGGR